MKEKIKKHFPPLILVILLITLDQVTKIIARGTLSDGPFVLIDGVFEFRLLFNTGVAWGMFDSSTYAISALAVLIMAVVAFFYFRIPADNKRFTILRILFILIFSGAAGNIIDRIFFSAVTDFLYFSLIDFPVFNVADCYVTVSGILTAILLLFYYKDKDLEFLSFKKKTKEDVDEPQSSSEDKDDSGKDGSDV